MTRPPRERVPHRKPEGDTERQAKRLIRAAFQGRNEEVIAALRDGARVDTRHEKTGLTPLHIAAGSNNLKLAKILVEEYVAPFGPDAFGRWPTTVAAECRADTALLDYIVEAEAAFLGREAAQSP